MGKSDHYRTRARRPLAWGALAHRAGRPGADRLLVLPARTTTRRAKTKADDHDHDRAARPPAPSPACRPRGAASPSGRPWPSRSTTTRPAGPSRGLDKADIVFEEPVEGGITRYAAVFQCQNAALIGPVRSARNIDIGILGQLGNPLLAHVGGINPVLANIDASPIVNVDLGDSDSLMIHPAGQVAPDSDYTSTAIVYGTHPTMTTPPQPLFTYSTTPPPGGHARLDRAHRLLGHLQRHLEVEPDDQHVPALLQRH